MQLISIALVEAISIGLSDLTDEALSSEGASRYQHSPQGYEQNITAPQGLKDRRIAAIPSPRRNEL